MQLIAVGSTSDEDRSKHEEGRLNSASAVVVHEACADQLSDLHLERFVDSLQHVTDSGGLMATHSSCCQICGRNFPTRQVSATDCGAQDLRHHAERTLASIVTASVLTFVGTYLLIFWPHTSMAASLLPRERSIAVDDRRGGTPPRRHS